MGGAKIRIRWRGGSTCHVDSCHHTGPADPVHTALVVAGGATEAAVCSSCMRRLMPIPSTRVLEAARPAWDGIGDVSESAVLALVGLRAAQRVIADACHAHESTDGVLAAERLGAVDRRLRALADEAAGLRTTNLWRARVGDAAAALVLARWYDSDVEHWPAAAVDFMRDRHPVTYESPAMSARLREVAAALLIGSPSPALVTLIRSLSGSDIRVPWADGPDRRQALDPLEELTQWGLVAEAEGQHQAFLAVREPFASTLGRARCDLVAQRSQRGADAGRLELGPSPNWLWLAVLHGFVGRAEDTAGSPAWDAASVPALFRLALVGSGHWDPVDVQPLTPGDRGR